MSVVLTEHDYLTQLVILGKRFRTTPATDEDFEAMRREFDSFLIVCERLLGLHNTFIMKNALLTITPTLDGEPYDPGPIPQTMPEALHEIAGKITILEKMCNELGTIRATLLVNFTGELGLKYDLRIDERASTINILVSVLEQLIKPTTKDPHPVKNMPGKRTKTSKE